MKFLRDGLFSIVKRTEQFGIDKDLDVKRSKTDTIGYNIAISADRNEQPVDESDDAENSEQADEAHIPNDNPIMRFILENFKVQDHTNADEYGKLLNLLVMNDQIVLLHTSMLSLKQEIQWKKNLFCFN